MKPARCPTSSAVSCRARKRFWHFVSPEYAVRYLRFYFAVIGVSKATGFRAFERFFRLPPFDDTPAGENTVKRQSILLFDPKPIQITCVSGGARTENGVNGTEFDGWLIFDGKGFTEYLKNYGKENDLC